MAHGGTSRHEFNGYRSSYRDPYRDYSGSSFSSSKYTSSNGYSGYSGTSSLLEKSRKTIFNGTSALPSRTCDFSRYSGTSSTSSRTGRSESKTNDIVRPSMRSRNVSMPRDLAGGRRDLTRGQSLSRVTRDGDPNREYPELSPHRNRRSSPEPPSRYATTPVVKRRNPVPEFKEIRADYSKPSRMRITSKVASNGSTPAVLNGHVSPTRIETRRIIHNSQIDEQVLEQKTCSPSFAQNRTSNNNKDYDESTGSSRSSTASRRDDIIQNGDAGVSSSSSSRDFSDINAGRVGLKNIGNTCFMNSILQCLSNTKPLRNYCIERRFLHDLNKNSPMKGKLVEAFYDIIRELWYPSSSGSAVSTTGFKTQIQKFSKRFSGYEQQDSQEFLRFLIEGLHEDVNKITRKPKEPIPNFDSLSDESKAKRTWDFYLSKDRSYVVDLFMGQLKSSLKCAECSNVSTTFDPFWDLSLPIPKNSYNTLDLQSCLDNFTKAESLEGDERPTCDRCKARRRMTKKFTIHKFPRILVIHLKRFSEGQRFRQKLSSKVEFPHRLEITSPVSTSPVSFNLYAVSNHSGSCYGGHYTAYCKNPETEHWHSFNDSLVQTMSPSSVQSKEAYVLFYEMSSSTRSSRSHL